MTEIISSVLAISYRELYSSKVGAGLKRLRPFFDREAYKKTVLHFQIAHLAAQRVLRYLALPIPN